MTNNAHDDRTQSAVSVLNVETPSADQTPAMQKLVSDRYHELGLSFRDLAAKTIDEDGQPRVSHGTLSNIYRGHHKWRFDPATLEALAIALDVPLSRVHAAAGQSTEPRNTQFRLPERLYRLSPRNRRIVVRFADALMDQQNAYDEVAGALNTVLSLAGGLTTSELDDFAMVLRNVAKVAPNDDETVSVTREQVEQLVDLLRAAQQ